MDTRAGEPQWIKVEVRQIASSLSDIYEGLCRGSGNTAVRLYLMEAYQVERLVAGDNARKRMDKVVDC